MVPDLKWAQIHWGQVEVTEVVDDIPEQLFLSISSTHQKKSKQYLDSDLHVTTITRRLEVEPVPGKYWERNYPGSARRCEGGHKSSPIQKCHPWWK